MLNEARKVQHMQNIPGPSFFSLTIQSSPGLIVSSGLAGLVRIFEGLYSLNLAKLSMLWRPNEGAMDA